MIIRIQTGKIERIESLILGNSGEPIIDLTDICISIRRNSDDYYYDFDDDTFKSGGWVIRQQIMTEVDSINSPGEYYYIFITGNIVNVVVDDTYHIRVDQINLSTAKNVPQVGEIKAGEYVDDIDIAISTRATPVQVKSQTDQSLVDYDPPTKTEMDILELNIRGTDNDDLKVISDQIDNMLSTGTIVSVANIYSVNETDLEIYQGDNKIFSFVAYNGEAVSGNELDLTDASIWFTVKHENYLDDIDDVNALFQRRNISAGGGDTEIKITDVLGGVYDVYVVPSNTVDKNTTTYAYDVKIKTGSNEIYTTIRGDIKVKTKVTRS